MSHLETDTSRIWQKAWTFPRCFCLHARHSTRIRAACTQFLCSRGLSVAAARYFHHPSAVDSYYWTLGRRGREVAGGNTSFEFPVNGSFTIPSVGSRRSATTSMNINPGPLNRPASPITSTPCVQLSWTRFHPPSRTSPSRNNTFATTN